MNTNETKKPEQQTSSAGSGPLDILLLIGETLLLLLQIIYLIGEGIFRLIVPVTEKSVKGEVVLITGTGHGIGRELALQYASEGATVVCWDINEATNQETVKLIAKSGYQKAHAYVCDVTKREDVLELAKKVQKEIGDVDILINNAGIMPTHPFLDQTVSEIELTMNINVMAHFWILQAFLPAMIKRNHGHIVALSSCAGIMGIRNLVPYCASKYAVRGMMVALYEELRTNPKCQIKTTLIYPYMVDTGLCKKPKMRFSNLMPMLNPTQVAEYIMRAQRRNIYETTIPRYLLSLTYFKNMLPIKADPILTDFVGAYPASDL